MAVPDLPYKETSPIPFGYVVLDDGRSTYTPDKTGILHEEGGLDEQHRGQGELVPGTRQ